MKKRLFAVVATLALLIACAVLAVQAENTDVRDSFVCPCSDCADIREDNPAYKCPEKDQWLSISTATDAITLEDGQHYYVGSDTTAGGQLSMAYPAEAVLLIDHSTLRAELKTRMFNLVGTQDQVDQPMTLHVVGNNGGFLQQKYVGSGTQGLLFQVGGYDDTAKVHLYGDLTLSCEAGSTSASSGGLFKIGVKAQLHIHDHKGLGLTNENDPTLIGYTATDKGGAIFMQKSTSVLTMDAGTIRDGKAKTAGNVYVAPGATFNMQNGSISGGEGTDNGGAVYVDRDSTTNTRGVFNMSGGTVTVDGTKSGKSKGVRLQGGILNLSGDAEIIAAGGSEGGSGIDALRGLITLDGNARVYTTAGKTAYDILVREYAGAKVTVKESWKGTAGIRFKYIGGDSPYVPGGEIDTDFGVSTGDFAGHLYLQTESTLPRIYGKNNKLVFSDVAVYSKDGVVWCKDNAEAVKACAGGADEYIKLFNDDALELDGGTYYVDFNGRKVSVSGTGKVCGFDSSASATGEGAAQATLDGVATELFVTSPTSGESFVTVTEGNAATFHVIKPVISGVNLRGNAAGIYYDAKMVCDDTLAQYIKNCGIAVQLDSMPGLNFKNTSMYTEQTIPENADRSFNGVLVKNILKENADNNTRAERVIYANAYVTVEIGGQTKTYLSSNSGNGAAVNLKEVVRVTNAIFRSLNNTQKTTVIGMYNSFKTDMTNGTWHVGNIAKANGEALYEDGVKILMIGNSLSVDAGRMLAYVFAQEGYDNVRVSTLYKSGCKLWEHADFLRNDTAAYAFFDSVYTLSKEATFDEGCLLPKRTPGYTLKNGIEEDDWDIIVMQQGSGEAPLADTYNEDIETIIDYVLEHDKNPATKPLFFWNSIWGYPYNAEVFEAKEEDDYSSYVTLLKRLTGENTADAATQIKMVDMITQAARTKILTNGRFDRIIPSGTAFIHGCAKLSNQAMYNDYIHANDLGRLVVAYVWYSTITGNEVTDMVNTIPGELRRSVKTDLQVTQTEEDVLVACIADAFAKPYIMPDADTFNLGE